MKNILFVASECVPFIKTGGWIMLCEMWINGEISDDVALEGNY